MAALGPFYVIRQMAGHADEIISQHRSRDMAERYAADLNQTARYYGQPIAYAVIEPLATAIMRAGTTCPDCGGRHPRPIGTRCTWTPKE